MPSQKFLDVTGRIDTWFVIFSAGAQDQELNRWMEASTDEGCRHVYAIRAAGPGIMQVEETQFACFCEYSPVSLTAALLEAKSWGNTVIEWGVDWTPERMKGRVMSETLSMREDAGWVGGLEKLRAPVYVRSGYFSCVSLVKLFLNINNDKVLKPRELLDYLKSQGATEV